MPPVQNVAIVASANPTIMVSEHSTELLEATGQPIPADTILEEISNREYATGSVALSNVPEHVTYGQDPEGQQRSDYKRLGNLLRRCGIEHADCELGNIKLFWPITLLQRILTPERIVEELDAPTQTGLPFDFDITPVALANQILDGRIKIFAVLLLLDQVQCIERALKEGLLDTHLPFEPRGDYIQLFRTCGSEPLQLVRCFSGHDWKPAERDNFCNYQQAVDPRILELEGDGRTPKHEEFHSKAVLPFMKTDAAKQGLRKKEREYGGFGVVSVVKVHPACHRFHDLLQSIKTRDGFALKLLLRDDLAEFQKEVDALKVFNGFAHPHMVTLLMTWKWNGSYYLLFPLARCDLDKYWQDTLDAKVDVDTVQWMSKQLVGISSAVASIHDPASNGIGHNIGAGSANLQVPHDEDRYGRHGDLKPDNILLYDSPMYPNGILVVADMGLSRLNSILSRSAQSNSRVPAAPRYKAPERDIFGAKIKRSYDIWTFGCLALEWVCWLFGGQHARERFIRSLKKDYPTGTHKDMFFDMVGQHDEEYDVVIKLEVREKFVELHEDPLCTQYFHLLLELIEEKLLLTRADDRISAKALLDRLTAMDAVQDAEYFAKPCPMPHTAKVQDPLRVTFRRNET